MYSWHLYMDTSPPPPHSMQSYWRCRVYEYRMKLVHYTLARTFVLLIISEQMKNVIVDCAFLFFLVYEIFTAQSIIFMCNSCVIVYDLQRPLA